MHNSISPIVDGTEKDIILFVVEDECEAIKSISILDLLFHLLIAFLRSNQITKCLGISSPALIDSLIEYFIRRRRLFVNEDADSFV